MGARVALRNDSYTLHLLLPTKVDPLVSLMKVEKVPDSTYDMIGGLDQQIKEIKEVRPRAAPRPARRFRARSHSALAHAPASSQLQGRRTARCSPGCGARARPGSARRASLDRRCARAQVIELPIKHPELFESLGVAQPKARARARAPLLHPE
jgi:hypothetical protein